MQLYKSAFRRSISKLGFEMKTIMSLSFVLLFFINGVSADTLTIYHGRPTKGETYFIKSKKGFKAHLFLFDNTKFFKEWSKPSAGVKAAFINKTKKDIKVYVVILFSNPGFDDKGLCDVRADYIFIDPKGDIYGKLENVDIWVKGNKQPKDLLQISHSLPSIRIEPHELLGRYEIKVILRDNIKNTEFTLSQHLTVEE